MSSSKSLKDLLSQQKISNGDIRYLSSDTKNEIQSLTAACRGGLREKLYWLQHEFTTYPTCASCGGTLSSKNFRTNVEGGRYTSTCSVRCAKRNPDFRAAQAASNLEKYGTDQYLSSTEARDRIKNTNLKKYGRSHPHPWGSEQFMVHMLNKYGVDHSMKLHDARERVSREIIERNVLSGKTEATIRANEARRNVECMNPHLALDVNRDLLEHVQLTWKHLECGKSYDCPISDGLITACPHCTSSASILELSLRTLVAELLPHEELIFNARNIIQGGLELDIYIPSRRLALEFNGIYWHSSLKNHNKFYHLNKSEACAKKGIRLIHIWEDHFLQHPHIVRSVIANACGLSERMGARATRVVNIKPSDANKFLKQNHLAGYVRCSVNMGLMVNEELVAVMSFGKRRFVVCDASHWEIYRFATKAGLNIAGGASKLFKAFVKAYSPASVTSFADISLGGGDVYLRIGMMEEQRTLPAYFWANTQFPNRLSRFATQKHKLPALLGESYDEALTEEGNMHRHGWFKLWDCGNRKFVWRSGQIF